METTMEEAIRNKQREIVVSGSRLSSYLMAIREARGWVWRMDVKGATYTLYINWRMYEEQQLLPIHDTQPNT